MITREVYALCIIFSCWNWQHHADVLVLIKAEDKFISLSYENVF